MVLILSFDPAEKTLGIVLVRYNEHYKQHLKECTTISEINNILKDIYDFQYVNSICLRKNKTSTMKERLYNLHKFITEFNEDIVKPIIQKFNEELIVLVEQQNPSNAITVPISYCLLYEYSNYSSQFIGATLKNTIELDPYKKYGDFVEKYSNLYTANKKHSENNFIYYLTVHNKLDLLSKISKKDDVSDAFMQLFVWVRRNISI